MQLDENRGIVMDYIEYSELKELNDYYDLQDEGEFENEELTYAEQKAIAKMLYENH